LPQFGQMLRSHNSNRVACIDSDKVSETASCNHSILGTTDQNAAPHELHFGEIHAPLSMTGLARLEDVRLGIDRLGSRRVLIGFHGNLNLGTLLETYLFAVFIGQ
jgi:hypothetical protein